MSEFLSNAIIVLLLVAAFAGLVAWVRRDTLTGRQYLLPTSPDKPTDDLQRATSAPSVRAGVLRLN